jgi:tetratricopeptide (TPR) repeat protein
LQGAQELRRQALALFRSIGNDFGITGTLCNLGFSAYRLGQQDEAAAYYEQVLERVGEQESHFALAYAVQGLAQLALERHAWAEARRLAGRGLSLAQQVGNEWVALQARQVLALANHALGATETAEQELRQMLGKAQAMKAEPLLLSGVLSLAQVWQKSDADRALRLVLLALSHPALYAWDRPRAQALRGELAQRLGSAATAAIEAAEAEAGGPQLEAIVTGILGKGAPDAAG